MVSLYKAVPFLHGLNPFTFKFFLACIKDSHHFAKYFLYIRFPLCDIFFDTTLPRLFIIKSDLTNAPLVLSRVPLKTCLLLPRTDFLAFLLLRTTFLAFLALRLLLDTLLVLLFDALLLLLLGFLVDRRATIMGFFLSVFIYLFVYL